MKKLLLTTTLIACCLNSLFAQPCLPLGITFSTQEEIDNFQASYPGCTEIEGSVFIQYNDITNLDGLSVVTSIGGYLKIYEADFLNDLSGLKNVTSVGILSIWHNDSLTSLTGLDSIDAGSICGLEICNNQLLSTCEIQSVCDYLVLPNGWVNIYDNANGCNNPSELANACGNTLPCLPYGNYNFLYQTDIDNFQSNYPGCTDLEGNVKISGNDITNLNGLNTINSIGGQLTIVDNPSLTSLTGLENLTSITNGLHIGTYSSGGNPALISLTGLQGLTTIGGTFQIRDNDALMDISALENLTSIGDNLWIYSNDAIVSLTGLNNLTVINGDCRIGGYALTSLTGLENITTISGDLEIWCPTITNLVGLNNLTFIGGLLSISSNDSLLNLTGLENLTFIGGNIMIQDNNALTSFTGLEGLNTLGEYSDIWIGDNDALTSFSGFDNLISVIDYINIYDNNSLTSLLGLQNLTSIGGGLDITNNDALTNLSQLGNVTSIGHSLVIKDNDALTSLTGLDNVTSISGAYRIENNDALTSLSGLDNIDASSIAGLYILENNSLSMCAVQSVCDYLNAPNGDIQIEVNAPGCNSQQEVIEACDSIISGEVLSNKSTFSIYPNPATKEIFITTKNENTTREVNIYNQVGQRLIHEKQSTNMIDVSSLKQGMYVIELLTTESRIREKLIIR